MVRGGVKGKGNSPWSIRLKGFAEVDADGGPPIKGQDIGNSFPYPAECIRKDELEWYRE